MKTHLSQPVSALPIACQGDSNWGKGKILERRTNGAQVNSTAVAVVAMVTRGGKQAEEKEEGSILIDNTVPAHLASIHVLLQRERKSKSHTQSRQRLRFNTWQQLDQ